MDIQAKPALDLCRKTISEIEREMYLGNVTNKDVRNIQRVLYMLKKTLMEIKS